MTEKSANDEEWRTGYLWQHYWQNYTDINHRFSGTVPSHQFAKKKQRAYRVTKGAGWVLRSLYIPQRMPMQSVMTTKPITCASLGSEYAGSVEVRTQTGVG